MIKIISGKGSAIGDSLHEQGWWSGQLLPLGEFENLLKEAVSLYEQGAFQQAAMGARHSKVISQSIRGDETCWVEGVTPVQQHFLDAMLELKSVFESYFPIPLNNFDGHYSFYPAGTFYRKHMDNARQSNSRIFSVVNYLNPDWQTKDGGELVLFHPEKDEELACIKPEFGTTAIFFSTDFPHEVRETHQPRFSLTGWFHQRKNSFL